mgnify:CR=1 FL=1
MTISGALSNALSGLNASSRIADIISTNLANVLTEGYAPREISLQSQRDGRGVAVAGVIRHVDTALLGDRRLADSARAGAETHVTFAASLERAIGAVDDVGSLSARLTDFEASLITAAARPEEPSRLQAVVDAATGLTGRINEIAGDIETLRSQADAAIARTVGDLDAGLQQVVTLNSRITAAGASGRGTEALQDERQRVVDRLAEIVPLRQLPRAHGAVALMTTGGAVLLDGRAVAVDFDAVPVVAAHMTQDNGLLSGLSVAGQPVSSDAAGPLGGGRLSALFDNRDRAGPEALAALDDIARVIVERVAQPGLDPTLGPGEPGLFTDAGAAFDPAQTVGLSGRIAVNAAVDSGAGGALSRLRDGLGAVSPGPPGQAGLLQRLSTALETPTGTASDPIARTIAGHVAAFAGQVAQARLAAEETASFATGQASELRALELESGVDSDAELQRLLLVEQSFAANARMIQTVDDMMQTLLRI